MAPSPRRVQAQIQVNDYQDRYDAPILHSPRAERPASLTQSYFDHHDEDALNIDLDQHDPYRYGSPAYTESLHSTQAGHQAHLGHSPFADVRGQNNYQTFDQNDSEERDYVERYLLQDTGASDAPVYRPTTTYQQQSTQPYDYSPVQYLSEFPSKEQDYDAASLSSHSGKSALSHDDNEPLNPHFGLPPVGAQLRRNKTKKRVALTHGNLVLDCPIPSRLTGFLPRKDAEEFRFMRYSAVTCDPDNFEKCQFTVRPAMLNRETELAICITMFNEDEVLFCRTMHHVMKNIAHLCSREKSSTWGAQGWKKVVVCIVVDGRKNVHPRVLDCLSALGVYQPGVAKNIVEQDGQQKPVVAHMYEYTTQLSVTPDLKFRGLEKGIVPTQIIFCMKENNAKKINSHRWFFNAFAPMLQPNICILLDVGTLPGPKSLYHLWKTFNLNSNVGGACGEIVAMKGKLGLGLLNPLVAAQNFEYKISNILDKPTESVFGYISVLPGAFSAYRYIALLNDACGQGPLASYFKGETLAGHDADVFSSNMYLAEDRILCWELVAKRNSRWVLKYVSSAQGETDVPDTAAELISQRRRWLNGSFFAAVYALTHVFQVFKSEHTAIRKIALLFEAFYNLLNLLLAWFSLGTFYCFFMILTSSLEDPSFGIKGIKIVNIVAQYGYAGALIAVLLFAMGNRPQSSRWKYLGVITAFCLLTAYMIACAIICCIRAFQNMSESTVYAQIILSLVVTYGVYVVSSILALDPWHLVTSMGQYLLMQSVYINVFNVYAFANLHDFSWGTKSLDVQQTDLGVVRAAGKDSVEIILPTSQNDIDLSYDEALHSLKTRPRLIPPAKSASEREILKTDYYRSVRTNVLLAWTLSNAILAAVVLHGDKTSTFALPNAATAAVADTASRLVRRAGEAATESITSTPEGSGSTSTTQIYMLVILVFVTFMSVVRFIGSTTYLIIRLFAG